MADAVRTTALTARIAVSGSSALRTTAAQQAVRMTAVSLRVAVTAAAGAPHHLGGMTPGADTAY
jgi:hypothetical protein